MEQEEQTVYLPALLNDEFGISRTEARMHVATGDVVIDGRKLTAEEDKFLLERTAVLDKEIHVRSGTHGFRFRYRG